MTRELFFVHDVVSWLDEDRLLDRLPSDRCVDRESDLAITNVQIDSRSCSPGSLFVALPGARTDGHRHLADAADRGAVAALVEPRRVASGTIPGRPVLIGVRSSKDALAALARRRLDQFAMTRIGITGSNGKTTCKEMLAAILAQSAPTLAGRGNHNSDVGLPLELFRAEHEHRYGVFELAMNRRGEIGELAAMVRPDAALITNIGTAHIGMLGSRDQIAAEKRDIFRTFTGSQVAFIPADDDYAAFLSDGVDGRVVPYGPAVTPTYRGASPVTDDTTRAPATLLHFDWGDVTLSLVGEHMVRNALGAVSVAQEYQLSPEQIRRGLESVRPAFGRGELIEGAVRVYQDCYNANPESMAASIATFAALPHTGRRIMILGGMRELGREAADAHRRLVQRACAQGPDVLWLIGDEWSVAAGECSTARWFPSDAWDELIDAAGTAVEPGDLVLLKGSRAYALERLTAILSGVTV